MTSLVSGSLTIEDQATDPRDARVYTGREAIRYCDCGSVREWIASGLIAVPRGRSTISFWNLVEIHVIRSIEIRSCFKLWEALTAARTILKTERPLISRQTPESIAALAGVSFDPEGAPARIQAAADRVEYDAQGLARALFPAHRGNHCPRSVCIRPGLAGGQPVVTGSGVPTRVLADRFRAGDSIDSLSHDFHVAALDVEEALRFEVNPRTG